METLTQLVPEISANNISGIAAFSLILKYIVDLIRYVSKEFLNTEISLDPKIVAGITIFIILLVVNRESISSLNDVTDYAGQALTLAASTWFAHKLVKNN